MSERLIRGSFQSYYFIAEAAESSLKEKASELHDFQGLFQVLSLIFYVYNDIRTIPLPLSFAPMVWLFFISLLF